MASTNPQVCNWIKLDYPTAKDERNAVDRIDEAYLPLVPMLVKAGVSMLVRVIDKHGIWGDNGFAQETVVSKGEEVPRW